MEYFFSKCIKRIPAFIVGFSVCFISSEAMSAESRKGGRPLSLPACFEGLSLASRDSKEQESYGRSKSCPPDIDVDDYVAANNNPITPTTQQTLIKFGFDPDSPNTLMSFQGLFGRGTATQNLTMEGESQALATSAESEPPPLPTSEPEVVGISGRTSFSKELEAIKDEHLKKKNIAGDQGIFPQKNLWKWQPQGSDKFAIPVSMAITTRGQLWQPDFRVTGKFLEPLIKLISGDGVIRLGDSVDIWPLAAAIKVFYRKNEKSSFYQLYNSKEVINFNELTDIKEWSREVCSEHAESIKTIVQQYLPPFFSMLARHNAGGILQEVSSQLHGNRTRKDLVLKQSDSNKNLEIDCYIESGGLMMIVRSHFDEKLTGNKFTSADTISELQITYRFITGSDNATELRCVHAHFQSNYRSSGFGRVKGKTGLRSPSRRQSVEPPANLRKAQSTSILDERGTSEQQSGVTIKHLAVSSPKHTRQLSAPPGVIFSVTPMHLGTEPEVKSKVEAEVEENIEIEAGTGDVRFIPFESSFVATNCDDLLCGREDSCQDALANRNYEQLAQMGLQLPECLEARAASFRLWYPEKTAKPVKNISKLKPDSDSFESELREAMVIADSTFKEAYDSCPKLVIHAGTLSFSEFEELQSLLFNFEEVKEQMAERYERLNNMLEKVTSQNLLQEEDLKQLVEFVIEGVKVEHRFRGAASPLGKQARRLEKGLDSSLYLVPLDYQRQLLLYYQSLIGQLINLVAVKGQVTMENVATIIQLYEKHLNMQEDHEVVRKIRSVLDLPDNKVKRSYQDLQDELVLWKLADSRSKPPLEWFCACIAGAHTDLKNKI